ncbi:hypothetical protein Mapa_014007 [Marchantia paleacea]|nr:hypothetical protein Mapa_014007 [Marchantia paleacea]
MDLLSSNSFLFRSSRILWLELPPRYKFVTPFFSAVDVSSSSAGTSSSVGMDCGSFSCARVGGTSSSARVEAISS